MAHPFQFHCSCEILPSGDLWCCDVCSTTLDLRAELVTDESDRLLGYDQLLDVTYTSEADALRAGVSEEEILDARERCMEYHAELDAQREYAMNEATRLKIEAECAHTDTLFELS